MQTSRFWKLLALELLVVGGIGAYMLIDSHDVYRWWVGNTHFVESPANCNLHVSACTLKLPDGMDISFEITPHPIPLMQALRFRVHATNSVLEQVELKLFATNMNMGFHSFTLRKISQGIYEGEGMLPTCVVGNMIWQAHLIFNKPNESVGAIFTFQTDK